MLAIAHRTPATRERCAALAAAGASVFEIDVQSIGGELVVSHFLPVSGRLPALRRDRMALTWRRRTRREIPLAAALDLVPAGAEVLLDLKTDVGPRAHALVEQVAAAGLDPARCHVSTKGWDTLPALARHGYRTWRSVADEASLERVLALGALPDHAVTVRHRLLDGAVVDTLRAAGPLVVAWTINSEARAREVATYGVDGITSDSPAVLRLVAELA